MKFTWISAIIAVSLITSTFQVDQEKWMKFQRDYKKNYNTQEKPLRLKTWRRNTRFIDDHNAEAVAGNLSYFLGVNDHADRTFEELSMTRLGFKLNPIIKKAAEKMSRAYENKRVKRQKLPQSIDWRRYVSSVKDQGTCGSCWAFSTVGAVEAYTAIKNNKVAVSLSVQQLVECDTSDYGCEGGWPSNAFNYIYFNGGVNTNFDYAYTGATGNCSFNKNKTVVKTNGYATVYSEALLKQVLATRGPAVIAISVEDSFFYYKSGVYQNPKCNKKFEGLNHAMLAVGYGTDPKTKLDYFLVKNTWSPYWGERGYVKILSGKQTCGIGLVSFYPII